MILDTVPQVFWDRIAAAPARLLMLDYDGTLASHRVERDLATPYPGIVPILEEICRAGHTRLVLISGRGVEDLLPLLSMPNPPECWGSHGMERRLQCGELLRLELTPAQLLALNGAIEWAIGQGHNELRLERKPHGVALHWRGLTQIEVKRLRHSVKEAWWGCIGGTGLELVDFDGGMEIRPLGVHKGLAVEQLISEEGSEVVAAYLGDDLTDEDAFLALGEGLSILVRSEVRDTRAGVWLKPPEQLLDFLIQWNHFASLQTQPQEPI